MKTKKVKLGLNKMSITKLNNVSFIKGGSDDVTEGVDGYMSQAGGIWCDSTISVTRAGCCVA